MPNRVGICIAPFWRFCGWEACRRGTHSGIDPPTVGRHIAMLQASLGGRVLFTRSQSGLMPTAAAHELRPHAEDMAAAAAAFVRMGSGNLEENAGGERRAAADVVGVEILPPILSEFRYRYPRTVIELSLSNQMADLLRRDADIAVRMVRPKQKALLAKRAGKVALGFHAHRRYLERYGYPERLEDLAHHTLIGFDRTLPFADLPMRCRCPHARAVRIPRDNDLAQCAASGLGGDLPDRHRSSRSDLLSLLGSTSRSKWKSGSLCTIIEAHLRMRLMFDHLALNFGSSTPWPSEAGAGADETEHRGRGQPQARTAGLCVAWIK